MEALTYSKRPDGRRANGLSPLEDSLNGQTDSIFWIRAGIVVSVTPQHRIRLEAIVADRNTRQRHAARARVIGATADGCGTTEIMRRSGLSKPVVWRWQAAW